MQCSVKQELASFLPFLFFPTDMLHVLRHAPLYSALVRYTWSTVSSAGLPGTRGMDTLVSPVKGQEDGEGAGASLLGEANSWGCSAWREGGLGDLITAHKYLKGRCKEGTAQLVSGVPRARTRGNGQKVAYGRLCLNTRNTSALWG